MRTKEYLTESSRAYLYHATTFWNVKNVLESNRLRAGVWTQPWRQYHGSGPEEIKGISLTRDHRYAELYEAVVLVLDQEKLLRDGYKIYPYDYKAMDKNFSGHIPVTKNEFEEFVPGAIENLDRYLISVYFSPEKVEFYKRQNSPTVWNAVVNHPKYQAWLPLIHRGKQIDEEVELIEAREAPIYHNMRIKKAMDVFTKDALPGTWEHMVDNKMQQGTSFSRNVRFARQIGAGFGPIMIEVNQAKLSQRYKIIPLDAELIHAHTIDQRKYNDDVIRSDKPDNKDYRDRILHKFNEPFAEEFVIGPINELHHYIDKIFILDKSERNPYSPMKELVKVIKAYGKKHNIKVVDMYDRRQKKYKLTGPYAEGPGATGIVVPTKR